MSGGVGQPFQDMLSLVVTERSFHCIATLHLPPRKWKSNLILAGPVSICALGCASWDGEEKVENVIEMI
jgi:hypothetical protein